MATILLVEDDDSMRLLTTAKLKHQFNIVCAGDGVEALEVLERRAVDLIIADVMMPRMDGYTLVKTLRERGDSIPVLLLTAKQSFEDKREGFSSGIDDYMTKPVNYEELTWRLNALLRRSRIASEQKIVVGRVVLDSGTYTVRLELSDDMGSVMDLRLAIPREDMAAMLSALAIMPAVFAFGVDPTSGPSLLFITLPGIFREIPMGNLFAVFFFVSVAFAGITSLINMFEAVIESWQNRFRLPRKAAVLLCGGITLAVGLFLEAEPKVGSWMDFVSIVVVPTGAVLGAISIYYVLGYRKIREELETGREKPLSRAFGFAAKFIYVPLTILVLILGFCYGGIG